MPTFSLDSLIRSMGVNDPCRHMLLLGAGCSITSGIPSGGRCVWHWKGEIFLSANPHVRALLHGDTSLPHVQDRIQAWLDARGGFPPRGDDGEYAFYAEACYPDARDRRKFFDSLIAKSRPALGYRLLGLMIEAGHFRWIWTTNFDDLVDAGRPDSRSRVIRKVGMDSSHRLEVFEVDDTALRQVWLHGDYRYDPLRNTASELQALDHDLREELVRQAAEFPMVVLGYSGSDESIMSSLEDAYRRPGKGGLFWMGMRGKRASPRVERLIGLARAAGRTAHYVESDGFDQLMLNLARYILRDSEWAEKVEQAVLAQRPPPSPLALTGYSGTRRVVKSNSWPAQAPDFIFQFPAGDLDWDGLRGRLGDANGRVCAGLYKDKVVAVGTSADIRACFGTDAGEELAQVPVRPGDLFWETGTILSVLREALVRALVRPGLEAARQGRQWFIFDTRSRKTHRGIRYYEAVEARVEQRGGRLYLSLIPDRWIPKDGQEDKLSEGLGPIKNALLGRQYNRQYNDELNRWRQRLGLASKSAVALVFPADAEVGFKFAILPGPVLTQAFERGARQGQSPRGRRSLFRFEAFETPEPKLRFFGGADIHPIRGLLRHAPYECQEGPATSTLSVGVVAPDAMAPSLGSFLHALHQPHSAIETKHEYLVEYPGFREAFHLPLDCPQPGTTRWTSVPLRPGSTTARGAFQETLEALTRAVDRLIAGGGVDVVVVGIPRTWSGFERVEDGLVDLDLHDQLKAYCAARGIRTQLIRERTFTKKQRNEVLWWLALALYAKSRRTPWLLDRRDDDVAFVGIGHAIDRRNKGKPIVLGCSHVFQASGVGLRFQLSRIQDPVWRGKNPFLGKNDALRVGYQTRQLFQESLNRLPKRVLLCKRTPFLRQELEGLRAGLDGVDSVDFLTLEEERAWRYLAGGSRQGEAAGFPIRRGTGILVDRETFFLWVHGAVEGLNDRGRVYFQGKTRIPTPIRVRRYGGSTSIEEIAADLMGLSKMDWNSFDLYGQWPAPVSTPGRIARIGRLLERFERESFDYRLFM